MRVKGFTFDRYPAGDTDFAGRYAAMDPTLRPEFDQSLSDVERAIYADPLSQPYASVVVIGHSDRQDLVGLTHQEAQASEAAASLARAESAWAWVHATISSKVGPDHLGWEETSPKVTWAWVSAGSGQLVHPNPLSEDERLRNRRVEILFSHFEIA